MTVSISDPVFSASVLGADKINAATVSVMNSSPTFQNLFAVASANGIPIRIGDPSKESGTFFLSTKTPSTPNGSVVIDPDDFTNPAFIADPGILVARIAHELAHAADSVKAGSVLGTDGLAPGPTDSSNIGPADYNSKRGKDEGLGLTQEFFVAKELGLGTFSAGEALFKEMDAAYGQLASVGLSVAEVTAALTFIAGTAGRNDIPSTNEGLNSGLTYGQVDIKTFIVRKLGFTDVSGNAIDSKDYPTSNIVEYAQNDDGSYRISGIDPRTGELVTKQYESESDGKSKLFSTTRATVYEDGSRLQTITYEDGRPSVTQTIGSDNIAIQPPKNWFQKLFSENVDSNGDGVADTVVSAVSTATGTDVSLDRTNGATGRVMVSVNESAEGEGWSVAIIADNADGQGGINRVIDIKTNDKTVKITQHANAVDLANGEQTGDFDTTTLTINGLDLTEGAYAIDPQDLEAYGFTFENLATGTLPASAQALLNGIDPARIAANGWASPQVVEFALPQGFTRTLELGNGTTLVSTYNDDRRLVSLAEITARNSLESTIQTYAINADGSRTLQTISSRTSGSDGSYVGVETDILTREVYRVSGDADGNSTRVLSADATANLRNSDTATVFSDINALVGAIRSGQPIPVLASGVRLLSDFNPGNSNLAAANTVAAGVLSFYNLYNAMNSGDSFAQVNASLSTINYANEFLKGSAAYSPGLSNFLNGGGGSVGVLPALGLITSIKAGDPIGMAMSIGTLVNPAFLTTPAGWVLMGASILQSLFSDDSPPDAWGVANVTFGEGITNYGSQVNASGENFGPERVRAQLQGTLDALNGIIGQANSGNPDSRQHLGLIPQRMPSLNYRAAEFQDKGYSVTDIDPLTGAQRAPFLRFDDEGKLFGALPGQLSAEERAMLYLDGAGAGNVAPLEGASGLGNSYTPKPDGIQVTSTNGQSTLYVSQVHDLSSLQANEDGFATDENVLAVISVRGNGGALQGLLDNDHVSKRYQKRSCLRLKTERRRARPSLKYLAVFSNTALWKDAT